MPAPLTVTQRVEDNIGILELSGALTLGPSLIGLRNSARQLIKANNLAGLIVHTGAVTHTDSSGLGELTVVYSLATMNHCPLRLVSVKPDLKKILEMTRLDGILPKSDDIASAKSELKKARSSQASSRG
jgi:anti-anti-sigma factor